MSDSSTDSGIVTEAIEPWTDLIGHDNLRRRSLVKGELLFRQGDRASAIYLVESGRVCLVRHVEDGSCVVLHTARAGDTLAEAALFSEVYHCDAVAEVPAQVAAFPKAELLPALEKNPVASLRVAHFFARQVRGLRARLELRNIRSAEQRLLAWLGLGAKGNPPTVSIDRPWTEIAPELGLTHEAVYRAISALERSEKITRIEGAIVLETNNKELPQMP
jgi:CRP-like cAMP-binding protein